MFATVASFFGVSVLRLGIYAACVALVVGAGVTIRQHYINKGYASAIEAVKKQDDRAVAAADKVKERADACSENSWWDVVNQECHLEDAE